MPVVQAGDVADLVATTLDELGKNKFTDLVSDYRNTIAMKRLIKKGKMTFDAGEQVSFNVMFDHNNSARGVGLGYTLQAGMANVATTGSVPWRFQHWNWAMERRLVAMNRSPARIVDMVKQQRIAGLASAIIYFEQKIWRVPSTSNTEDFYGIPYYVVKSNTAVTTNDGFNGSVPSGYTTVANLSPTTYQRWRNYATQYTAPTHDDLVRKWRRMLVFTKWEPLVDEMPTYDTGEDYGQYTNYSVLSTLEELLEDQNDNLGTDVASMDGKVMFRRRPVTYVNELDDDTTNPVYSLYWGEMGAMGLRGEWMVEQVFDKMPSQPTMMVTVVDNTMNLLCRNRRRQGVLATDTSMPA